MANLPPRPTFTNLGDGAPVYNSRRQSASQPGGLGARNPSHPRHYHPYDRQPGTTSHGSPIPPWRRDASRQSRSVDTPSQAGQHYAAAPFASRIGKTQTPPAFNGAPWISRRHTGHPSNNDRSNGWTVQNTTARPSRLPSTPRRIGAVAGPGRNAMGSNTANAATSPSSSSSPDTPPTSLGSTPMKPKASVPVQSTSGSSPVTEGSNGPLTSPRVSEAAAGSAADWVDPLSIAANDTTPHRPAPSTQPGDIPTLASRKDAAEPEHPLRAPLSPENASHAGPEHAAAASASSPLSHPAAFSMNVHSLAFNLSKASDRSDEASTPSAESGEHNLIVCAVGSGDNGEIQPPVSSPSPFAETIQSTAAAIPQPISLSPAANTTVVLTLGPVTRTFLAVSEVLSSFTAWNHHHHAHSQNDAAHTAMVHDSATQTLTANLTVLIPGVAACPAHIADQHLDALQALLAVMHQHHTHGNSTDVVLSVDEIWRLGGLKDALDLDGRWVDFLRGCMRQFVGGIKRVGGWLNFGGLEEVGPEEALVIGESQTMERAANTCLVFGWGEELRVVMARLAYVCGVAEDQATGEVVLVKPGGRRVEVGVCEREVVDAILAARRKVVENLFAAAHKTLGAWMTRIGHHPCADMLCNTNRLEALIFVLRWLGLFPRGDIDMSLHELVTALQFTTATNAELMAAAIENDWGDGLMRKRFNWPMYIRQRFAGTCSKCNERAPTSMLFPLEDLLCELTFEMQDQLQEYVELRWP
ncbi:hypothetical protein N658DRAFT_544486 [Parathielavia hyrcaniae]|uniref:Uncharacterized protein n=1 Tax=Parathielavia hyrcaniae TaxID=113614 RepID=A0AAN6PZM4_9PEZI|nr:hypothetical protein N658DRAFT_544486 [Parathielavia hyrcaniae]